MSVSVRWITPPELKSASSFCYSFITADGDYLSVMVNRSIAGGSQSLPCVVVVIVDDADVENCMDEVFGVTLIALTPRVMTDGGSATVYVVDDDQPGGIIY